MSRDAASRARQLAGLKPFQKGQSGNPNGRPKKVVTIASIAEENGEKAMRKIARLVDSSDDRVALAAANAILDRAMGRPKQALDVSSRKDAAEYTEAELLAIARLGSPRAAAEDEGEREPDCIH